MENFPKMRQAAQSMAVATKRTVAKKRTVLEDYFSRDSLDTKEARAVKHASPSAAHVSKALKRATLSSATQEDQETSIGDSVGGSSGAESNPDIELCGLAERVQTRLRSELADGKSPRAQSINNEAAKADGEVIKPKEADNLLEPDKAKPAAVGKVTRKKKELQLDYQPYATAENTTRYQEAAATEDITEQLEAVAAAEGDSMQQGTGSPQEQERSSKSAGNFPTGLDLMMPANASKLTQQLAIVEMPSSLDVSGDMGVIGRMEQQSSGREGKRSLMGLDLKGELYSLQPFPVVGQLVMLTATGIGGKAKATVSGIVDSYFVASAAAGARTDMRKHDWEDSDDEQEDRLETKMLAAPEDQVAQEENHKGKRKAAAKVPKKSGIKKPDVKKAGIKKARKAAVKKRKA